MNKSFYFVAIALLSLSTTFSCTKDVDLPDTPIEPEKPIEPTPEKVLLSINPTIAGMEVVSTRGIITQFTDNDKIGLFLTDGELGTNYQGNAEVANMPAMYTQGKWNVEKEVALTTQGTTYAYYPHNTKVTDGTAVPVEISSQTDYLYAQKTVVDKTNPIAQIGMKHALSLVSVRIRKNDYQFEGKLTKIEVLNVQGTGTVNISSGEVMKSGPAVTYSVDKNLILDDNDLVKTQMIMLPTVIAEAADDIRFKITIDGKYYLWDIPKSHTWEAGKEYTYTLNLGKAPEVLPDLELDVDYWTKYGKDDNIQLEDHTQPGSAYYRLVDVEMGRTAYGRTVVQGESFIFTGVVNDRKQSFKGRIKYTLWQGDKMVEQFPSYYFEGVSFITLTVPCFITSAPGVYRLKMLLKEEGKNFWILPSERNSEERDWIFTVQAKNNTPSIKSMNLEGFTASNNAIREVKLNEVFNMEYTMTNRTDLSLKGEIKAVWHRTFTGEFELQADSDGDVWEDEIGRVQINLPGETKEYKGKIPCTITINRNSFVKNVPAISFYYKADGTSNWVLMRSDSDSELQRWKGIDIDKQLHDNTNGNGWWCEGGLNYQYVALE